MTNYSENLLKTSLAENDIATRAETVLNATMAEFDVYHTQKNEDFGGLVSDHLDGEINHYEQVSHSRILLDGRGRGTHIELGPHETTSSQKSSGATREFSTSGLAQSQKGLSVRTGSIQWNRGCSCLSERAGSFSSSGSSRLRFVLKIGTGDEY